MRSETMERQRPAGLAVKRRLRAALAAGVGLVTSGALAVGGVLVLGGALVVGGALVLGATPGCGGRTGLLGDLVSPDPEPGCGNGVLEGDLGEKCDLDNLGGRSCESLGFAGGTLRCSASCELDPRECLEPETCGDGVVDPGEGEECDGADLAGQDCASLGFAGGTLACSAGCRFDTGYCVAMSGCGDLELDPGEECDDGNRVDCDGCSATCEIEACGNGVLECEEECDDGNRSPGDGCGPSCQLEYLCGDGVCEEASGESCASCPTDCCPGCGDGVRDPAAGEQCDGADLGGQSCATLCYDGGTLGCGPDCTLDESGCYGPAVCGDGVAECDEQCDRSDLRGADCADFGFSGGTLGCDPASCTVDTSGCSGFLWYLYEDFEDPASTQGLWSLGGNWEWGTPTGALGEPAGPSEGTQCLGTRIGYYYSNDQSYDTNVAVSPPIDLTGASQPVLTYDMWLHTEQCCDGGAVFVRPAGGSTWTHLDNPSVAYNRALWNEWSWTGLGFASWQTVEFSLAAWAGQTVEIGFGLFTDGSVTEVGMYVDEVLVTEASAAPVEIVSDPELGMAVLGDLLSRQLVASGGGGSYQWSLQPGGLNDQWLAVDPQLGVLSGTPGPGALGPVEVIVRAAADGIPTNYDEQLFELVVVDARWQESFDSGLGGWTLSGDWEWGTPSGQGPPSCRAGSCLGTVMSGDYHDNQSWGLCAATSPVIDLTSATAPVLRFWAFVDTEGSQYDGGNLKVSTDGITFSLVSDVQPAYNLGNVDGQAAWGGHNMTAGWQRFEADLSLWAGQTVHLRFDFRSDASVTRSGVYVDELLILD